MAGEMDLLFDKVFQNPLLLKKIVRHITLKKLYPFRQVSKMWKNAADVIIKERAFFSLELKVENQVEKLISDLQYFGSLKLCNLHIDWSEETGQNLFRAFHLKEYGKQVKTLYIYYLNLITAADFIALEFLLTSMPNLRRLEILLLKVNVPLFFKFNPKVSIEAVQINATVLQSGAEEAIVSQILKIFPNLVSNFSNPVLDNYLLTNLSKLKGTLHSLCKLRFESDLGESVDISLLNNVNPAVLPNLKRLYFDIGMTNEFANSLKKGLTNFSRLEKLCDCVHDRRPGETVVISLPPLKNLRILRLAISPIISGNPNFLWDLGKQLAKDYPVLVELFLKNVCCDHANYKKLHWKNYNYPETWCIWEPFVPIFGEENVDFSPLKTLKTVEFGLPPHWVRNSDNVDWAKSFLDVCNKLYPKLHEYYNEDIQEMRKFVEERGNVIK